LGKKSWENFEKKIAFFSISVFLSKWGGGKSQKIINFDENGDFLSKCSPDFASVVSMYYMLYNAMSFMHLGCWLGNRPYA